MRRIDGRELRLTSSNGWANKLCELAICYTKSLMCNDHSEHIRSLMHKHIDPLTGCLLYPPSKPGEEYETRLAVRLADSWTRRGKMAHTAKSVKKMIVLAAASFIAVVAISQVHIGGTSAAPSKNKKLPVFEVDPAWPQLPNGWVTGAVPAVAVDRHDNIWILARPNTVPDAQREHASPPVVELDASGKFVQAWGGPGTGYDWPDSNHSIFVDYKDNVWITGSSPESPSPTKRTDDMLLKFTNDGKFIRQLGGYNKSNGNADTKSVHLATDVFVYRKTNEVFVSDGYGNRRVIVFDADTLAFKRMWGAFGNAPADWQPIQNGMAVAGPGSVTTGAAGPEANRGGGGPEPRPTDITGPGPDQFGGIRPVANQFGAMGGPTHSVQISNDGLVYVTDRSIRRVQVFTIDGKYVTQAFVNRTGPSGNSACSTAFSPDKAQQFLYVADYGNSRIVVMDRKSLQILYQFGGRGAGPGRFLRIHHIAVDSKGNIYTGEVAPGPRTQKFVFKGYSETLPANALTPQEINAQVARPALSAGEERSSGGD